jgi:hemin uptake protein HemP
MPEPTQQPSHPVAAPTSRTTGRVLESSELLAGEKSVLIRHENELYRLTVTRNGKLLLQK